MIHSTAIIDPSAELASDVKVGPYTIINAGVSIDSGTTVESHVVISGPTRIGKDNHIYPYASVGCDPQDKKYSSEETALEIGDGNVIREYCTISRGTSQDVGVTRIGNDNWIMAYVHIAHDCQVGDHTIFANAASLAGHVIVEDYVIFGGFTNVHQFCRIGAHCFTGMSSVISKDVPPYMMITGHPAHPHGLNTEGLKRRGFSTDAIQKIKRAYKLLYKSDMKLEDAKNEISSMVVGCPELEVMCSFLDQSTRGILR
ncbi:MAG: acyl-ACP--UDP-N-acetylglucosamine O-acyltransferase [Gammaproteobacteria bacterium]|nr:acyl-ACP--UDP-N-acetylglucosamine O-acyltransferase [Gammaproteobacteria bacterium]MCK5092451.1 acyl-ACP--UDP-N-acetylglucosamine O-acyltransferase [Gammaproteobacteria bacterium]